MAAAKAELVEISGASFLMGSEAGPDDEKPVHRVSVDSFLIGARQVTNEEYAEFERPPYADDPNFNDPRQPVVAVSWFDATRYCDWLNVRLPTEAEWECAARGGLESKLFPWGDEPLTDRAMSSPARVGMRPPNAYGLYDMCENVHEWCNDWYDANYYRVSPERNPRGPDSGSRRVSRGGAWRHQVKFSRSAARSSLPPAFRYTDYGFRIAATK